MSLIIELICPGCVQDDCLNHQTKTRTKDNITGLEFEIRCICGKHKTGVNK